MDENELSKIILDASFDIHKKLGPGLFESVCESVLAYELGAEYGLLVDLQVPVSVVWKETKLNVGFRADMIIDNKVIVEI